LTSDTTREINTELSAPETLLPRAVLIQRGSDWLEAAYININDVLTASVRSIPVGSMDQSDTTKVAVVHETGKPLNYTPAHLRHSALFTSSRRISRQSKQTQNQDPGVVIIFANTFFLL
jgi:hypothetical protein